MPEPLTLETQLYRWATGDTETFLLFDEGGLTRVRWHQEGNWQIMTIVRTVVAPTP